MFNLYENIESLCRKHNTNPTQVCVKAGLGRAALSNLKHGRCKTMTMENLQKIADVLGEPFDVVAHGEHSKITNDISLAECLNNVSKTIEELKEKTAIIEDDSLSREKKSLIELVKTMDDDKIAKVRQLIEIVLSE